MKFHWCFWILVWIANGSLAQQKLRTLPVETATELPLKNFLYQLPDSTGYVDILEAIRRREAGQFLPSVSPTFRQDFGYNINTKHWLYFALDARQKADLMLEIEYANIDRLELFEVKKGQIRSLGLTGDSYRFSQRPYKNNNYVYPLRLQAGEQAQYYLMLDQPNAILSFYIRLWPRAIFLQTDRDEYFLWGIFIGIVCIVGVVTLVMLLATKDWIYFWYNFYLHCMTMHLFSDAGLGFQYLWSDTPTLNEYTPVYLYIWAAMLAQTTFMQYFIQQTRNNSRVYWWVNAFKIVVLLSLVSAISIHLFSVHGRELYMYNVVAKATRWFVLTLVLLTALSLYERRKRQNQKEKLVRYYGYALIVQFTGYSMVSLINYCQDQGWVLVVDVETYVIIGTTVLLDIVFFSYGLAYRYNSFREKNRTLELTLLDARQNRQRRVIDSLEEERRRLAQDLHDDVGATLATAKGYLSMLTRQHKLAPLLQSQALLDQAAEELRTISHQLMPKQFDKIGLAKAIEETIRKVSAGGIEFGFVSMGQTKKLDTQTEMLIFSMATELVRNVQKHAQATEATVQLIYHPDMLNLTVEDNGRGFDTQLVDGIGLRNLQTKAQYLKADLLIDSNAQGTSVMLSVPTVNEG